MGGDGRERLEPALARRRLPAPGGDRGLRRRPSSAAHRRGAARALRRRGVKTLVLALEYPTRSSYYDDWRDAFAQSRLFDVTLRNILLKSARKQIAREIGDYEIFLGGRHHRRVGEDSGRR